MATNFYLDDFIDTADSNLSAHTADIGGGYTNLLTGGGQDFIVVGDGTIRQNSGGFQALIKNAVTPPQANYLMEGVFTLLTAVQKLALAIRIQDNQNFLYVAYTTGDGKYHLIEQVTGGNNDLGSVASSLASPETIQICIAGQTCVVKKAGVVIIGPVTVNSALNVAGSLGFWAEGTLSDDVTGLHISSARAQIYSGEGRPDYYYRQMRQQGR